MDAATTLFLMIIAGVLIPPIRKLMDLVYRQCSSQIRKINEQRNHRTQLKNDAENAVRDALKSWDYAEKYREEKIAYVQAYGGYYPTILEETACWENAVAKCKKAITALELSKENDRVRDFRQNVLIASQKIEALRSRSSEDSTRTLVVGIDEAKRREYDAKLAKNNNEDFIRI